MTSLVAVAERGASLTVAGCATYTKRRFRQIKLAGTVATL